MNDETSGTTKAALATLVEERELRIKAEAERDEARAEFSKLFATAHDGRLKAEEQVNALREAAESRCLAAEQQRDSAETKLRLTGDSLVQQMKRAEQAEAALKTAQTEAFTGGWRCRACGYSWAWSVTP